MFNRKLIGSLAVIVTLFFVMTAWLGSGLNAADKKSGNTAHDMVAEQHAELKPPQETENLKKLMLGAWTFAATATAPDGSKLAGNGTVNAQETSNGFGVSSTILMTAEGIGEYHESDLFGVNPWTQEVHMFSVTCDGAVHDHAGRFQDDRTLNLRWEGIHEGKNTIETVEFHWKSDDELVINDRFVVEGQPGMAMMFTCHRTSRS